MAAVINNSLYDVAIIGAGVSSLPCAELLLKACLKCVIIDKGKFERDPYVPHDLANGFAGASLYSDGKISFKPAGTAVWKLKHAQQVADALRYVVHLINDAYACSSREAQAECESMPLNETLIMKEFETPCPEELIIPCAVDNWNYKPYPAVYIPLSTRLEMIRGSLEVMRPHCLTECIVHSVSELEDAQGKRVYQVAYQRNGNFHETLTLQARHIVLAGGRFMPYFLKLPESCERVFRRIELGVRISCEASNPIWQQMRGTDPKYLNDDGSRQVQWRTFCCCREGEVVLSSYNGIHSYSGRADCTPTEWSNTGFNARFYDPALMKDFRDMMQRFGYLKPHQQPYSMSLTDFLDHTKTDRLRELYGPRFWPVMLEGVRKFIQLFPGVLDSKEARVHGPTIEGCGMYWKLDESLRIPEHAIWVAGDSSGTFRGLAAAMVSGHYVGQEILKEYEHEWMQQLPCKIAISERELNYGLTTVEVLLDELKHTLVAPHALEHYSWAAPFTSSLALSRKMAPGCILVAKDQRPGYINEQRGMLGILVTAERDFHWVTFGTSPNPSSPLIAQVCKQTYGCGMLVHMGLENLPPKSSTPEPPLCMSTSESPASSSPTSAAPVECARSRGTIHNRIANDISYSHTYPDLVGKPPFEAMLEVHIFLLPLNPDRPTVERYKAQCAHWNALHQHEPNFKPMKACVLALDYRDKGEVVVMQSARYVSSNDKKYVIEQMHADADFFADAGFDVVREKVEASIYGIDGIPQTSDEMAKWPTKYFEFHMRLTRRETDVCAPITAADLEQLKLVSKQLSAQYGIPIPLSYNKEKHLEGHQQRFINLRFRGIGAAEAKRIVNEVKKSVQEQSCFVADKVISEYVIIDSFTALDQQWID